MAIPVPIPPTPLTVTDDQVSSAETLLTALLQVLAHGTTGASVNTPPLFIQLIPDTAPAPLALIGAPDQIFYRMLAMALATWTGGSPGPGPTPTPGITGTATTTSASPTALITLPLSDSSAYWVEAKVVGRKAPPSPENVFFNVRVLVGRESGGGATISDTVDQFVKSSAGASAWNVTFTTSGNDVLLSVTGDTSTIQWAGTLNYQRAGA